jgi:hypothetical protein
MKFAFIFSCVVNEESQSPSKSGTIYGAVAREIWSYCRHRSDNWNCRSGIRLFMLKGGQKIGRLVIGFLDRAHRGRSWCMKSSCVNLRKVAIHSIFLTGGIRSNVRVESILSYPPRNSFIGITHWSTRMRDGSHWLHWKWFSLPLLCR